MTASNFCEESFFFLHIDSICRSPADTCPPTTGVVDAARIMQQQNIAGLIVSDGDPPVGIVTAPHTPVPFARELERAYVPGPQKIDAAIRKTIAA